MRNLKFIKGEYYHIYNRGVDKRTVFEDEGDLNRFFLSMLAFNSHLAIGSIYEKYFAKKQTPFGSRASKLKKDKRLVEFVAYCFNPNHYHLLLTPLEDASVSTFMQKLGTGYTKYFNEKHTRTGSLFQGKFKAVHIDTNEQLLHVSSYVNLNFKVHNLHQFGSRASKLVRSSWEEYVEDNDGICDKDIVLGQFKNPKEYKKLAEETVMEIRRGRQEDRIDDDDKKCLLE